MLFETIICAKKSVLIFKSMINILIKKKRKILILTKHTENTHDINTSNDPLKCDPLKFLACKRIFYTDTVPKRKKEESNEM